MANLFMIGTGSVAIGVLLLPFAGPARLHVRHDLLLSALSHRAYWWAHCFLGYEHRRLEPRLHVVASSDAAAGCCGYLI